MNKIVQTAKSTKNFVSKHRVAIAVAATTVVCYKAHTNAVAQLSEFLAEKGLLEEFYALGEE